VPKSDASTHTLIQKRKDGLVARLNRKEKISAAEAWLDNANHVEEDAMVSRLETAYYEHGFARLDAMEMGLVEKLEKFAGEAVKISANTTSKKAKKGGWETCLECAKNLVAAITDYFMSSEVDIILLIFSDFFDGLCGNPYSVITHAFEGHRGSWVITALTVFCNERKVR
jgi:hypothetical protein